MKSFIQLIKEDKTEGAVFEEVIVAAWNGTPEPKTKSISPDAGKKIVKYLKTQINGAKASKLATKEVDVTSEWSKFWLPKAVPGSTKTPKTDILIGDNRISVKMGPAQLMSGSANESTATFYAALNSMYKSGIDVNTDLFQEIWAKLDTLTRGAIAKGKVEGEIKKGKDKFLEQANKVNNEVKVLMQKAFENEEFRLAFVREAMTGEIKFSPKSNAYADYVLSSDPNGDKPHLYKSTDKTFLNKVAQKASVTVRFKSTSVKVKKVKTGEYKYWSVIAIGVKKLEEELEAHNGMLLTESLIGGIVQRVTNFIMSLFKRAYEYLKSSVHNIAEFFDLQPEVHFNNTINFSEL
jgi:hypothetical protein